MGFVAIVANPGLPINPYPPPASPTTALPTPTQGATAALSPTSPPSPTRALLLTPTPLRPATPTPTPGPSSTFSATIEVEASPGCNATTLVGTVRDSEGEPLIGYPIHVWGNGTEAIVLSGSAPAHGPSGWEFSLPENSEGVTGTWNVQLHQHSVYRHHPALSAILRVEVAGTCSEGLVLIHFREREE